ncbi:elongation of very long chain fatty acids protein AAEL008004-like [Oppia nitens]|uniref:elongation of very long chain fatty acids protein AAEL008004-like n=1 Tax=Oppia nitens TaxID=1686743 RepID=UPI0023DC9EBD|nr:elongation of very long chain fatty acids protein AAEL008004-like [Oppia nitens]
MKSLSYFERLWYYMDQYWEDIGDPRVNHWPLIRGGIWRILALMCAYVFITRVYLPYFMQNRKEFKLKKLMLFYNIVMICANVYAFYWSVISVDRGRIFLDFSYPSRKDMSDNTLWFLYLGWYFMLSRLLDLFDTVFIVLRKKDSQITSLHLYHHTVVPLLCWVSFKYNAMIPIIRMFVLLNSAIHTLMYSYYALAAFGPAVRPYLWWKRYLTLFQIMQFVICGSYGCLLYYKQTDYPMDWFYFVVGQNPLFFLICF